MIITPETDGVDHINVYSKGKTLLGRQLSNFAFTPFDYNGKRFASVEAWWYWQGRNHDEKELRQLFGFKAKQIGRLLPRTPTPKTEELYTVYSAKLAAHPQIQQALNNSTLPFSHYYVYNDITTPATRWLWTAELWNNLRS